MIDRQKLAADLEKLITVTTVGWSDTARRLDIGETAFGRPRRFINVKVDCLAAADHVLGMLNAFVPLPRPLGSPGRPTSQSPRE
jgi:hypothetical protein